MMWGITFALFVGYVIGLQVGKGRGEAYRAYLLARIDHADRLVRSLESFIFVAKTDGRASHAVAFADQEVQEYKSKYID